MNFQKMSSDEIYDYVGADAVKWVEVFMSFNQFNIREAGLPIVLWPGMIMLLKF